MVPVARLLFWATACRRRYVESAKRGKNMLIFATESQPIVTCIRCSSKTCFNHNVLYHEGQSCKQYDRSRPIKDGLNRSVSRVAIWWKTRNCPGCFQPVRSPHFVCLLCLPVNRLKRTAGAVTCVVDVVIACKSSQHASLYVSNSKF